MLVSYCYITNCFKPWQLKIIPAYFRFWRYGCGGIIWMWGCSSGWFGSGPLVRFWSSCWPGAVTCRCDCHWRAVPEVRAIGKRMWFLATNISAKGCLPGMLDTWQLVSLKENDPRKEGRSCHNFPNVPPIPHGTFLSIQFLYVISWETNYSLIHFHWISTIWVDMDMGNTWYLCSMSL